MGTKQLSLFLFALVCVFFGRTLHYEFINFDDNIHIYENPIILSGELSPFVEYWKIPANQLFIPMTYSFWHLLGFSSRVLFGMVDGPGGLSPTLFHAASILLHALNALLVFWLLLRLTQHRVGSLLGALLFALHPIQVEAVAWISAQKDCLATLFSLSALLLLLKGSRVVSTLLFALALLSKPSAIPLPAIAFLLCRFVRQKTPWTTLLSWVALACSCAVVTQGLQPDMQVTLRVPRALRFFVASDTLLYYLSKFLVPMGLVVDPGRRPEVALSQPTVYFAWLLSVSFLLIVWERRHDARVFVPGLGFLVALIPVLGMIPFGFQNFSTVADRYLYFPMLFLALGLSLAIRQWGFSKLAFTWIGILCLLTWQQTSVWQSSPALYTHTLEKNPRSAMAYNNLASLAIKKGLYDEGLELYQQSLRFNPPNEEPRKNLVKVLLAMGRVDEAAFIFGPSTLGRRVGANVYRELASLAAEWKFPIVAQQITNDLNRPHRPSSG